MNFPISRLFCSLALCFYAACGHAALADMTRIFHSQASQEAFEICQGGGCYEVDKTSLSAADWQPVAMLFTPASSSAEEERARIAKAVGLLENIVGKKVGTTGDLAGTFNDSPKGQQDCNDEAINTTTYMRLLKQAGLMRFHEVEDTRTRNFFFTGWPHSTASMRDIKSGEMYAVDSWFYDNGHPAVIVPLAQWKENYRPDDSPIGKPRESQTNVQTVHVNQ